jgi:hypothetical protein
LRTGADERKALEKAAELKGGKVANAEPILNRVAKASFHNISKLEFSLQGKRAHAGEVWRVRVRESNHGNN